MKQNTAVMIGKSIFKDSPDVDKNIAEICLKHNGGGHKNASGMSCNGRVETLIPQIVKEFARIM